MFRLGRCLRGQESGWACGDGGRPIGDEQVPPAIRNHDEQGRDPQQRPRCRFYRDGGPWRRRGSRPSDLADLKSVNAHRPRDVLQRPLAEIDELGLDPAAHMIERRPRNADSSRLCDAFQPRRDIDPVAQHVLAVDQHVAQMNANSVDDAFRLGSLRVALGRLFLHGERTFDRRDNRGKLDQHPVAHRLEHAPAVRGDDRRGRLAHVQHRLHRSDLVLAHQPGVAHDVGGEDRGEFAGLIHSSCNPALRMPSIRRYQYST